ncbi:transporter [Aquabacterium sp.]|uniref:SphA family protein n=1 Tax=Aquabacterium sp. TaxID=1872578 RepID=UPI0035B0CB78
MITHRPLNMANLNQIGQTTESRRLGRGAGVALACAALVAALAAGSAQATENFGLRYVPGIGGGDMSAPLDPGWYGQVAMFAYHAGKVKDSPQGSIALGGPFKAVYDTNNKIDEQGILPRITYISTQKILDANIGFTALFPLINQKVSSSAQVNTSASNLPSLAAVPALNAKLAATTSDDEHEGSKFGLSDIELAPIMRWSSDAHQVVLIPAILLGTGDFKAGRAYNSGQGKYKTFRPTVQYSYIGEGWDFGIRAAYSISDRDTDTKYRSGNTWNFDWSAMKFINDSTRVGLQGFVIYQATDDTVKPTAEGGVSMYNNSTATGTVLSPIALGKGRAYGVGPAVSWIKDSGTLLVEGKVLKEFGVQNRPEGTMAWLTLSKPL